MTNTQSTTLELLEKALADVRYKVRITDIDSDGKVYLWTDTFNTWADGASMEDACLNMGKEILGFAEDCVNGQLGDNLNEFLTYVFKALLLGDPAKIAGCFEWQTGEN